MAANAPPSIGVQIFSNRLEGGDSREPKRNICPVCRTQFILERLAWKSHRDRQGTEQTTFYLHLFPYSFFTRSLLTAWYAEVQRLRSQDLGSFFIKADAVFRDWVAGDSIAIQGVPGGTMGVALPELAEALGNTPVLPIHACGQGYGEQFLQALETAVILARFFGCRALLSRLPVPILDLSTTPEVALCVEGMPRNLGWLLSGTADGAPGASGSLNAAALQGLLERLGHLHALKQRLWFAGFSGDMVHELATAMQDDALGIFAYLERTASPGFKPGRTKHDAVEQYVTLFFDGVLAEAHHGDVNRLLGRTRLVRSAYLFYIRQCIPLKQQEQALREDERVEMLAQPERKL
jgi:hypothetical protein